MCRVARGTECASEAALGYKGGTVGAYYAHCSSPRTEHAGKHLVVYDDGDEEIEALQTNGQTSERGGQWRQRRRQVVVQRVGYVGQE